VAQRAVNTLDRYVLREWLKVFLLAALGCPFLVMVIDLTDKLDSYLGRGIPKGRIALSYVFFLPETISLVLPVAVLFAVVFTVGALGRHSELTAAKASGVSFHRVVRPLVVASLVAGVLDLGLTELAPVTSARRAELLGEKQVRVTANRYNFVYRADGGWVYAIRSLEIGPRQMRDVILEREGTGEDYPTIVVAAPRAAYDTVPGGRGGRGGRGARQAWTLSRGAVRYLVGPGRETTFTFDALRTAALQETPTDLLAEPKAPDEMRYAELGRYIDALARSGSDTKKLRVERALKLSVPFACIIIALFGAPLAISTPRSGAAWGVAVCLATTFIDLLMFQLSKAVGSGGALPPTFAAWVPNLLVGAAGVWLLGKART
jgi:lipopolysaccharide export system permease protein